MWIKNFQELALSPERKILLKTIDKTFAQVNTPSVINANVKLRGNLLTIKGHSFDLGRFKTVRIIGFGKVSCEAAIALEKVLGGRIKEGKIIDVQKAKCEIVDSYLGSHPLPSRENVLASKDILRMAKESSEKDLVIVVVSGGGSALLCYPQDECDQAIRLYNDFLNTGAGIEELNIVRKHISHLKGGGLAKALYPATVIGLIFSDIPSNKFEYVASGPTYFDPTTVSQAQKILEKYNLKKYKLLETPKEKKFFKKVFNIPLMSNREFLKAAKKAAETFGTKTKILSETLTLDIGKIPTILAKEAAPAKEKTLILAAGEPKVKVTTQGGSGGRNTLLSLIMLKTINTSKDIFISLASDGIDNGPCAGAVADQITFQKAKRLKMEPKFYINRFDSYNFFKATGDLIVTGPTGVNVSDIMFYLRK